jgi:hypothetical protein
MLRRSRWISLLILFGVLSLQLPLQPVTLAQDIIPPNAFLLRNKGDRTLTFWLRRGNGPWTQCQLAAGERSLYYDQDEIWLATQGQEPVHYRLELGQRYKIIWLNTRWDVLRMEL